MTDAISAKQEFAELWQRHYSKLLSSCLSWTRGRRDVAEEVLARSTELALASYPKKAEELRHPAAWLRRITYHVFVDLHREVQRRGEDSLDEMEEASSGFAPTFAFSVEPPKDPERGLLQRERLQALRAGVQRLPERLREPMELFLYHELSYREIADRLALTEANVRKRMQHAREALKPFLEAYRQGDPDARIAARGPRSPGDGTGGTTPGATAPGGTLVAAGASLSSLRTNGSASTSPTSARARRSPPSALEPARALRIVPLQLAGGAWRDVVMVLREPLRRATRRRFESLHAYIRKHPRGWKRRRDLARLLRQEGEWGEAVPHYELVLKKHPRQPELWGELAEIQQALGQVEAARASYRQARNRSLSPLEKARWRAARCAAGGTRSEVLEALEVLRVVLDPSPGRADLPRPSRLLADRGRLRLRNGDFREAEEDFQELLARLPDDAELLVCSHDARIGAGDVAGAVQQLERALERGPDNPPALVRWLVHEARGRLSAEDETVHRRRRRLRELAPDWCDARYAEALQQAKAGIRERRESGSSDHGRSRGRGGGGIQQLEAWLADRGCHPRGALLLARLWDELGCPERAAELRRSSADAELVDLPATRLPGWL